MRVLVACEYSGRVRDAFRQRGHDALSCDLLPSDREGPHYQGDIRDLYGERFDLLIAHPPCTYLCSSGLHWNKRRPERAEQTAEALEFVRLLLEWPVDRVAVENPIGAISKAIRPPDQTIQPYQFGHDASKATCLWLRGLPLLRPTSLIAPRMVCGCGYVFHGDKYGCPNCCGDHVARPRWANQTDSGQNRLGPSDDRWKLRAETYAGIADAMAEQWGALSRLADGVASRPPQLLQQPDLFNL